MATAAESWLQAVSLQRLLGHPIGPTNPPLPEWPPLDPADPEQDDIDQEANIAEYITYLQELYFRRPMS